jgi:cytoskeleton protein RodZ
MTESSPAPETPLSLGDRLRSGRRARALSLEQAAQALHLEESLLAALEEERFAAVGAPVFVRGHLRNYARLLGIDEDAILAAYRSADPASEQAPRLARERERPLESRPGPMAFAAAAAVAVLAVVAWLMTGDEPAPPPPPVVAPPAPVEVPPVPAAVPGSDQDASGGIPSADGTPAAGAGPAAAEGAPAGSVRIEFTFTEDSWIRVGADGRWLADGVEKAGSARVIDAVPPVEVTLGNAAGVRLRVDGADYSLPAGASSPGSNVARFRIDGPAAAPPAPAASPPAPTPPDAAALPAPAGPSVTTAPASATPPAAATADGATE